MKQLLLLIFLAPISSFCQSKIDGIGPFRIGRTTIDIIDQIVKEKNVKVKQSSSGLDTYAPEGYLLKKTKNIFILIDPKLGEIKHPELRHDPNVKIYFIDYFEISGISISKLFLSFYKDTLYSVYADGSNELTEAMTLKYGQPKIESKVSKVKCSNRIAGEFEVEEKNYTSEWTTGIDSIKATSYSSIYYNDKCEKRFLSFFSIENNKLSERIRINEQDFEAKKEIENLKEKKKSLSDF